MNDTKARDRLAKGAMKRARREARLQAIATRTRRAAAGLVHTPAVYNVVYADPPWRFEPWSRDTGRIGQPTTTTKR
jgi:hypothetical protein